MLLSLLRGHLDFTTALIGILVVLLVVFLILPFHEWAHAFTALKLGDTSVKYRGRLTLNPLAHIDPFGALALLLFGFGWAKPVPIDTRNFKRPKLYMAITALMGPLANIVAAFAGGLIFTLISLAFPDFFPTVFSFGNQMYITKSGDFGYYLSLFFSYYIRINLMLAVFNLLPIPPLDGSKLLFAFLPDKWVYKVYQYQLYITIGLLALLWAGVLDVPLNFLSNALLSLIKLVMPPCANLLI